MDVVSGYCHWRASNSFSGWMLHIGTRNQETDPLELVSHTEIATSLQRFIRQGQLRGKQLLEPFSLTSLSDKFRPIKHSLAPPIIRNSSANDNHVDPETVIVRIYTMGPNLTERGA